MIKFVQKKIENYNDYKKRNERLLEKLKKQQQKVRLETTNKELAQMSKMQLLEKVKQIVEEQNRMEFVVDVLEDKHKNETKQCFILISALSFLLLLLLVGFANALNTLFLWAVPSVIFAVFGAVFGSICVVSFLKLFIVTPDKDPVAIKLKFIELELAELKKERRNMKKFLANQ